MKRMPVVPGLSVGTNALGTAVQGLSNAIGGALIRMRDGIRESRDLRHRRMVEQGSKRTHNDES
jgi:hypothetical protein